MSAEKREYRKNTEYDKKFAALDAKYDRVLKRLEFIEKDHTKEICELRAEQRRLAFLGTIGDSADKSRRDSGRRHSFSDVTSPVASSSKTGHSTRSRVDTHEESVWDVEAADSFVTTQNTQGESVVTKATPQHLREQHDNGNRNTATDVPSRDPVIDKNRVMSANQPSRAVKTSRPEAPKERNAPSKDTRRVTDPPPQVKSNPKNTATDASAAKKMKLNSGNAATPIADQQPSTSTANDSPGNDTYDSNESAASASKCDGSNPKEQYSLVVTRNGWTKTKGNGKDGSVPKIRGMVNDETKELFVNGLVRGDFLVRKDLEESVRLHCLERGIKLIYNRALAFAKKRETIGCKIVVRNDEVDKIMKKNFWPVGIWVREWFDESPSERERRLGNEGSSGDESQ